MTQAVFSQGGFGKGANLTLSTKICAVIVQPGAQNAMQSSVAAEDMVTQRYRDLLRFESPSVDFASTIHSKVQIWDKKETQPYMEILDLERDTSCLFWGKWHTEITSQ